MNAREPAEVVADNPGMDGSGARDALRGAARGALLGEVIDDDTGKGAAIGMMHESAVPGRTLNRLPRVKTTRISQIFNTSKTTLRRRCLSALKPGDILLDNLISV